MIRITLVVLLLLMQWPASAQTTLRIGQINNGIASYLRMPPSYVDARVLAANVAETHTPPSVARYVIFSATCAAFYARLGASVAVPAADVTDGSGSELNPSGYWLPPGTTQISVIAPATCVLTMAYYT
jgi:hypothetical protein